MQNKERPQFVRLPSLAPARRGNKVLKAGTYILASAILAFGLAYLPVAAGSSLTTMNVAPAHLTSNAVNRLHKDDPLARAGFDARWNAVAAGTKNSNSSQRAEPAAAAKSVEQRIPFGCEPAFSRMIVAGNFSARCLAAIDSFEKVAAQRTA